MGCPWNAASNMGFDKAVTVRIKESCLLWFLEVNMKHFPYLFGVVFGCVGFMLGTRVGSKPVPKGHTTDTGPAALLSVKPAKGSLSAKQDDSIGGATTKELLTGIDLTSDAACMSAGINLGQRLYYEDPVLMLNTLESALSKLPEHLRPAFWSNFRGSLQETDSTSGHLDKLGGLDARLHDFLNIAKLRGNEKVYDSLISAILLQGKMTDPDGTAGKILNLPDSTEQQRTVKKKLLTGMATSMVLKNPKDGLILMEKLEPDLRKELAYPLIRGLAAVDAPGALAYFLSDRYPGKADSATAALTLQTYIEKDPAQASAQIRDAPPSLRKDEAAHYLASRIAQTDFESALQWAQSIDSPAVRQQAVKNVNDRQKNPVPSVIDLIKSH